MKKIQKIDAKPKSNVERIDKNKAAIFKMPQLFTRKPSGKVSDDKSNRDTDADTVNKRRK